MIKCSLCKRKLTIVEGIRGTCRCTKVFCCQHIIKHSCKFDYKTLEQKRLVQENPLIVATKLNKI